MSGGSDAVHKHEWLWFEQIWILLIHQVDAHHIKWDLSFLSHIQHQFICCYDHRDPVEIRIQVTGSSSGPVGTMGCLSRSVVEEGDDSFHPPQTGSPCFPGNPWQPVTPCPHSVEEEAEERFLNSFFCLLLVFSALCLIHWTDFDKVRRGNAASTTPPNSWCVCSAEPRAGLQRGGGDLVWEWMERE